MTFHIMSISDQTLISGSDVSAMEEPRLDQFQNQIWERAPNIKKVGRWSSSSWEGTAEGMQRAENDANTWRGDGQLQLWATVDSFSGEAMENGLEHLSQMAY